MQLLRELRVCVRGQNRLGRREEAAGDGGGRDGRQGRQRDVPDPARSHRLPC